MPDTATGAPPPPAADPDPGLLLRLAGGIVGFFAFVQVYSIQAVLPLLQRDLGASVVQLGQAVGATVLAVAVVSPFMGMLSDKLGRKALIVGSLFFLALPTAAMALVHDVRGLTLLRFLQGLAVPGISVVMVAYIGEEFGGRPMTKMMSAYIAGTVLGGFSGRFLLGHLSEWMDWREGLVVLAAVNIAGAAAVARVLPASRRFVPNVDFQAALRTLTAHLRSPVVRVAAAVGACALFSLVACFTYVNLHLAGPPFGFGPSQLANVFAVYLMGVVVTPVAGRMIPKLGARRTIMAALGVSMSGLLLALVPSAPVLVVALMVMCCGIFVTQAATLSFIAHRVVHGRSLASGLYYAGYYGGGFVGAWIGGLAYAAGRWPAAVAVMVAAQALAIALAWRLMPGLPPARG